MPPVIRPRFYRGSQVDGPSPTAANVVPSDDLLPYVARTINVGIAGNITIVTMEGDEVFYENYIGRIPVHTIKVLATHGENGDTTAGNIVAEF